MPRHGFVIPADVGLANGIRRSLLSDLENWAPCSLTIRVNTSCQTDEYIAHRIGLIPFRRIGNGDEMTLVQTGGIVCADATKGCAFEAVHPGLPIMDLGDDATLDLVIHFDKQKASVHARYSTCAAVGMHRVDDGRHKITFELHDPLVNASEVMMRAIQSLEARVDDCLLQISHQPDPPPKSRCG